MKKKQRKTVIKETTLAKLTDKPALCAVIQWQPADPNKSLRGFIYSKKRIWLHFTEVLSLPPPLSVRTWLHVFWTFLGYFYRRKLFSSATILSKTIQLKLSCFSSHLVSAYLRRHFRVCQFVVCIFIYTQVKWNVKSSTHVAMCIPCFWSFVNCQNFINLYK